MSDLKFIIEFDSNGEPVIKNITGAVDDAKKGFDRAAPSLDTFISKAKSLAAGLGIIATARELFNVARDAVNLGDRLSDLSDQTGISVRALAGLRVTAEQYGTSIEDVASGTRFMMRSLAESADQSGAQSVAFQKLGFSTAEVLKYMSDPEGFLQKFGERLAQIPTHAEQLALAQDIASRAGGRLAPVLLDIAKNGLPRVSEETAKAYESLGRFADKMVVVTAKIKDTLVTQFFKTMNDIKALKDWMEGVKPAAAETTPTGAGAGAFQLDPNKIKSVTDALQNQTSKIFAQVLAMTDGAQAALRFQLEQDAMTQLGVKHLTPEIENQIDRLTQWADTLEQIKIGQFTNQLLMEAAAAGQTGRMADAVALATKRQAIETQYAGTQYDAVRLKMLALADSAFRMKTAFDQIAAGKAGVSQFQQQFGVQFQIDKDLAGLNLAKTFMTGFNAFKDDLKEWPNLVAAFNSAVPQLIQSGVQDPQEMLMKRFGLSSADLERLKSTLPAEVKSAFDATIVVGDQWGKSFDERFKKFTESAAEAAKSVQPIEDELQKLTNSAAKNLALKVDVAEALRNVQDLRTAIDLIPDVTHKELIYDVYYAMSPKQPFSQLLPAMQAKFSSLADLVKNATPDITMNIPNFNQTLYQIQALQENLNAVYAKWNAPVVMGGIAGLVTMPPNFPNPNADLYRNQAAQIQAQIMDLTASLLSQANSSGGSGGGVSQGGGGGGGASGAVVNIDLRGSSMSRNFLDDELIPALERGIVRATGQTPTFQVLN